MFIKGFEELRKEMFQDCGGKAAHLGELTSLNLNVPPGFSVLGNAYYHHLEVNDLQQRVSAMAAKLDFDDFQGLEAKCNEIRDLIIAAPVPAGISEEIVEYYGRLRPGEMKPADTPEANEPFVAVRSSVAMKDSAVSSFPGMMDTFHYVRGAGNVVDKVKECWASVWSGRAAFARHQKGLDYNKAVIAPTIQLMVNAEIAGVLFTVNPITGSKNEIVVESNWGLGETVVCGRYHSDLYVLTKSPCFANPTPACLAAGKNGTYTYADGGNGTPNVCVTVAQKKIAHKHETYVQAAGGGAETVEVAPEKVNQATLTDKNVQELCRTVCLIEKHYGCHQDIEFAFEKDILYILQARTAKTGAS